jgi:hypothetical protein
MAIRLTKWRHLMLDDYISFAAAIFLVATTGVVYHITDVLYIATALEEATDKKAVYALLSETEYNQLLGLMPWFYALGALAWTTIFFVKFAFLAFFRPLLSRVLGMKIYYWVVVAINIGSWPVIVSEPWLMCPSMSLSTYPDITLFLSFFFLLLSPQSPPTTG